MKRPSERVISPAGVQRLRDLYMDDWHSGKNAYPGGEAERWFHLVLDFLSIRGDEVISGALREQEERVINLGLSQEYLHILGTIVTKSPQHDEYDHGVLVLTASPEERAEALYRVLEVGRGIK